MRVTNSLMTDTVNRNLFKNVEQLLKTEEMISSGKRVNRPSDDPVAMGQILDYRRAISSIEQYDRNIARGESWLYMTDSVLGSVDTLLIRAKELAEYQATETANEDTREIAAEEVKNLYDQLIQLSNTKLGNSYIFSGYKTDTAPFTRDENFNAAYNGGGSFEVTDISCTDKASLSDGDCFFVSSTSTDYYVWYDKDGDGLGDPAIAGRTGISVDISGDTTADEVAARTASAINSAAPADFTAGAVAGTLTVTNNIAGYAGDASDGPAPGSTEFAVDVVTQGNDGEILLIVGENVEMGINVTGDRVFMNQVDIFGVLRDLKEGLEGNDTAAISEQISRLDDALQQVVDVRAEVGAKLNRLESTSNYWADFKLNLEEILTKTEDADITRAYTDLTSQEAAYEASLAAASMIIQPSLLDFLR